ncbi:MAG: hypothetical protein JWQ23_3860, partial [Herminiimonas sp.]|nr:hypothetical protein [Herminiimonas sp.]
SAGSVAAHGATNLTFDYIWQRLFRFQATGRITAVLPLLRSFFRRRRPGRPGEHRRHDQANLI